MEKQNKEENGIKYVIWNKNDNTYTLICSSCETKIIKLLELNDADIVTGKQIGRAHV